MKPSFSPVQREPLVRVVPVAPVARLGHLLILIAVLAFWGVGLYLTPDPSGHGTHQQLGLPPCAIYFLTGRPCPSCGLTTSVSATLHGNLALAWRANPFGILIVAVSAGFLLNSLMALLGRRSLWLHSQLVTWLLLLALLGWGLHGLVRFLLWG